MSIIHALVRLLLGALAPGTGRRRASAGPAPTTADRVGARWEGSRPTLPHSRSPYGLNHPLDGNASLLVRPYLLAHERKEIRARRRLTLLLAADFGIDLDTRVLHRAGAAR
ncbi:hypothetical protein [Streptomyces thermolilacinus]|uniref:hypothetical protein n=1 Tax=Streptomyces thermolilacinus TaxID=285540 RepID=UPI0033E77988